jgi:hypothetical protein
MFWSHVLMLSMLCADGPRMSSDTRDSALTPDQNLPARPDTDERQSSRAQQSRGRIGPVDQIQPVVPPKERSFRLRRHPTPLKSRTSSLLLKLVGALMVVLGGLLLLGAGNVYRTNRYSVSGSRLEVMVVLALATMFGGRHLYRNGWQKGHDVANVLAVVPAAVLLVLFTIAALDRPSAPSRSKQHDLSVLSETFVSAGEYRAVAASVWADYTDPAVTAGSWVRSVDKHMPTVQSAVDAVDAKVATIQDDETRAKLQAFSGLLSEELGLLVDLQNAVASRDPEAELAAHRRISELLRKSARVGQELLGEDGEMTGSQST